MGPPTEQLIRDYLNRLSMAARGRLNSDDRRALVTRAQDFIERNASRSGPPSAMQVAALLSRLGDPAGLVAREVARLTAERGAPPEVPSDDQPSGLTGRLRRFASGASGSWLAAAGNADLQSHLVYGTSPNTRAAHGSVSGGSVSNGRVPDGGTPNGRASDGRVSDGGAANGRGQDGPANSGAATIPRQPGVADRNAAERGEEAAADGEVPARPVWPAASPRFPGPDAGPGQTEDHPAADPASPAGSAQAPADPQSGLAGTEETGAAAIGVASEDEPATAAPPTAEPAAEAPDAADPADAAGARAGVAGGQFRAWLGDLASRAMARSRNQPLEAAAIVLLGLGGAVFPPVWLIGACVAAASKVWDYRDKWTGLVGPVVLLIIGTSAGLALSDAHHQLGAYLHEAWVYLNILSRLCAVLGTWYLAWRLTHPWAAPEVPPWNRAHRVD